MSLSAASPSSQLSFESLADGGVLVALGGTWEMRAGEVDGSALFAAVQQQGAKAAGANASAERYLRFDASALGEWDSGLMVFLYKLSDVARASGLKIDYQSLPDGPGRLLLLANSVPAVDRSKDLLKEKFHPVFTRVGNLTLWLGSEMYSMLTFLGLAVQSLGRFVRGKASYRRSDFVLLLQQTGVDALPIVALIAFLVGMIMAFVGAIQLQKFGADIFVADLVGLAMVREMGAMMTGIILCGRTGAAYAAQLGSMRIGEEIDALETFGISSMDFLVLPRILALTLMTPLLVIFADLIGIIGGMLVGVSLLDVTVSQFLNRLQASLSLVQISTGIIKSVVFGILIALTGCLRGMQSGSSADEVGRVTTSAVVTGITAIIIADALFAVIFNIIGL